MVKPRKSFGKELALFLLCVSVSGVSAQTEGQQINPKGPFAISVERRQAEQELRALPQKLREKREQSFRDPKILEQMNEDFIKLQTLRVEMVKSFAAGNSISPAVLKDSAGEIKDRASRLRSMLALSEDPKDVEIEAERTPTVRSVNERAFQLCLEISRFTDNPIFKTKGVFTVRYVAEAAKSLDMLISIAAVVEKESGRVR